jgi:hypothetical protein
MTDRDLAEARERKRLYEELERQQRIAEAADLRYDNWGRDSDAAYEEWASR